MKRKKKPLKWSIELIDVNPGSLGFRKEDDFSYFLYEMKEIEGLCADMQKALDAAWAALQGGAEHPEYLHRDAHRALSMMLHLRTHLTSVLRAMPRIARRTRAMPPLQSMSDKDYREFMWGEMERRLLANWEEAARKYGKKGHVASKRANSKGGGKTGV